MGIQFDRRRALDLWRGVTVATVRGDEPDLTSRQMAILMTVYLEPGPHTVKGLAGTLDVGKPAVTRALDTLSAYGLIRRGRDPRDARNVNVQRTVKGAVWLSDFGDAITSRAVDLVPSTTARH
jgi:DNA-binding MarR family transcriptional regulator